MATFSQQKLRRCSFDYFDYVIRSHDMKEWYPLILVCVPVKFSGFDILKSYTMKFLNVTWSLDYIT